MSEVSDRARVALAGRECGACTVCCKVLPIRSEEFRKTANVLCGHCDEGRGCRIYQTRPAFCREFYCEWRLNPEIPATWRPEKSGIFIQRIPHEHISDLPARYGSDDAVMIMLLRADAIERPAMMGLITRYLVEDTATFLAIAGPAGYLPAQIFLNEALDNFLRTRDLQKLPLMIRQTVAALQRQPLMRAPEF